MYYLIVFSLLLFSNLAASDNKKIVQSAGVPTPPATPRAQAPDDRALPLSILQRCEYALQCTTKTGEIVHFRVKLIIDLKPDKQSADVELGIFQGRKLITSRKLEFFW